MPGPNSQPFRGLGVGFTIPPPGTGDAFGPPPPTTPPGTPQSPRGINETPFRPDPSVTQPYVNDRSARRLFEPSAANYAQRSPLARYELLTKIANNITTRSNVFGMWLTVGFFEVTDETTKPARLGREINWDVAGQVRVRMFSIVDRTGLQVWPTKDPDPNSPTYDQVLVRAKAPINVPADPLVGPPPPNVAVTFDAPVALIDPSGADISTVTHPFTKRTWTLQDGAMLTYDPNTDREETVMVRLVAGNYMATFRRSHAAGCTVISRGNPGAWPDYDPANDTGVILFEETIDP